MKVVIVGCSGHGREVHDVAIACGHTVVGFVDDAECDAGVLARLGLPRLGDLEWLAGYDGAVLLGIGASASRAAVAARTAPSERPSPVLVHPQATCGSDVVLGDGTVVAAGARLTTNIRLGRHCYVGPNATIGHDTHVGDCVTVLPGATVSGMVTLGAGATVGTGASVLQGIEVGADAFVGAGAVVTRNVAPAVTVVGVPARPLR